MYLMRECSGQSLVKIGDTFGGRDHTTARHGILKVEKDMRARTATYRQVQDLSRIIRGRARRRTDNMCGTREVTGTPAEARRPGAPIPPTGPHVRPAHYARKTGWFPLFHSPYYY